MALDACLCDGLGSPRGLRASLWPLCGALHTCSHEGVPRALALWAVLSSNAVAHYPAAHLEAWPFSLPPPVPLPYCLCSWVSVDQPALSPVLYGSFLNLETLTWRPWRSPLGLFPAVCFLGLTSVSAVFVATEPGLASHPRGLSTPWTGCPHSAAHPCLTALLTVGQKSVPVPAGCHPPLRKEAWRAACQSDP